MKSWTKNKPYGAKSLLYQITVLPSGAYYVGRSITGLYRWQRHLIELRKGIHQNDRLQKAFNKYGESALTFTPIAWVDNEILAEEEQFLLDMVRGDERCMNMVWISGVPPNTKGRPKGPRALETCIKGVMTEHGWNYERARQSISDNRLRKQMAQLERQEHQRRKDYFKGLTETYQALLSQTTETPKTVRGVNASKYEWTLQHTDGTLSTTHYPFEWCRERQYNVEHFKKLFYGYQKVFNGWRVLSKTPRPIQNSTG